MNEETMPFEAQLIKAQQEIEAIRSENTILRGLVATITIKHGEKCHYCGIENMSMCVHGFPGCALADDLMCGENEAWGQLRAKLAEAEKQADEWKKKCEWIAFARDAWRNKLAEVERQRDELQKAFDLAASELLPHFKKTLAEKISKALSAPTTPPAPGMPEELRKIERDLKAPKQWHEGHSSMLSPEWFKPTTPPKGEA